jgi:site-specific DNA-cytosine methylase
MKIKNVLSLFDGMSCGQIALNRTGIKYENYFASEIDETSIFITQKNYPKTKQIGSVTEINTKNLPKIDLLFGGSPCQDLSKAKTDGQGLNGKRSGLFWEFVRILKEVQPTYFLLENVVMQKEWADIITNELGVEPIEINSNLVSAQNRRRMYWTNIPNVEQPKDKGITLGDIIYDDTYKVFTHPRIPLTKKLTENYVKWDISGKQYWSQQDRAYFKDKKVCTLPKANPTNKLNILLDYENDVYRRMHPIEAERCQNVPDNYTSGVSDNKRLEMLGNGWTVDVIAHIFSFLKQTPYGN